jgi:hypothetical protein
MAMTRIDTVTADLTTVEAVGVGGITTTVGTAGETITGLALGPVIALIVGVASGGMTN